MVDGHGTADAHIHLFGDDDVKAYERHRREHGIDWALVVGYEGEPAYAGNNGALRRWARDLDWVVPVAFFPTSPAPSRAEVEAALEWATGISLYALDAQAARSMAAWPDDTVAVLARREAVVSVNATPAALAELGPFVQRAEGAAVLISHLGLPPRVASPPSADEATTALAPLLALASHAHLGVKLSGLYASSEFPHTAGRPYIDAVAAAFGAQRLFWGSDFPPCLAHLSFADTVSAVSGAVPVDARYDVMGGNLARWVRVDPLSARR